MRMAIIGGGIGGLCTAIALENCGLSPVLFEAAPAFAPVGAGLAISPNALDALDVLGVRTAFLKKARTYAAASILTQSGEQISRMDLVRVTEMTGGVFSTIHRHDLHAVLLAALKRTQLHTGARLLAINNENNELVLQFANGSEYRADVVIAADGIHSPVRKWLVPDAAERFSGQTCWRGICQNPGTIDSLSESWGKGKRFGIVPLPENRVYWFAVADVAAPEITPYHTPEQLAELFGDFHAPVAALIRSTPADQIYHNDLMDLQPLKQFAFGKLLLLGDAAHATTPNLGQGACMAIEDAAVLQRILAEQPDMEAAFSSWEHNRIKRTTRIVHTSARFGKLAQSQRKSTIWFRNLLLRNLPFALNKPFYRFLFGYRPSAVPIRLQ